MHEAKQDKRERPAVLAGRTVRGVCVSVAVIVMVIAVSLGVLCGDEQTEPELAPLFTLPNLDGDDVSLAEYQGSVVIIDFWATWCEPCLRMFPEIHALQQAYADRGVVLLVVSLDKSAEPALDYLIENGFATDNVLWGSLDDAREVKALFNVGGIVHTLIIDRAGYIRFSGHPKYLTAELIEVWL